MSLITNVTVEYLATRRVRLSWTGTLNYLSWIFVNGRLVSGPLLNEATAQSRDLNITDPWFAEVHEGPDSEAIDPIAPLLTRRPTIWWSAKAGAMSYNVYRLPKTGGTEALIAYQKKNPDALSYEIQAPELLQDRGVWNFFRVEAVNARGKESVRTPFPFFVAGLPPALKSLNVSGGAGVFTLQFGT